MAVDHCPRKTQGRYALGRAPTGRNKAAAGTEQAVQHRKSCTEVVYEHQRPAAQDGIDAMGRQAQFLGALHMKGDVAELR